MPYAAAEREQALSHFKVTGIPRLVVLGPDGRTLVENAAGAALSIAAVDGWLAACR